MSIFGSLGNMRGAFIAAGTAAEKIEALEKERQDKIYDGFKGWVDKTVPRAGDYKTKATILRRKLSDQLEQVIDKYFVDTKLNDSQKVAGARALLKDHGNKIENIDKAYEQSSALSQILYNQASDTYKKNNTFKALTTGAFVNSRLANLSKLKTKETVDDAALFTTRTNLGDFNDSPEGIIKALSIYDGSNIFRTGFDEAQLRNVATQSLPAGMEEFRGAMPELARVERQNVVTTLEAMKEVQAFGLNEAKVRKYIYDVNKGDTGYTWKPTDWTKIYKQGVSNVAAKTGFKEGSISFTDDGQIIFPQAPAGSVEKKKYNETKQTVYDVSFSNLVKNAVAANQQNSDTFKAVAFGLAEQVSVVETPLTSDNKVDYAKLVNGRIYRFGNQKAIYYLLDVDAKNPLDRGKLQILPQVATK